MDDDLQYTIQNVKQHVEVLLTLTRNVNFVAATNVIKCLSSFLS